MILAQWTSNRRLAINCLAIFGGASSWELLGIQLLGLPIVLDPKSFIGFYWMHDENGRERSRKWPEIGSKISSSFKILRTHDSRDSQTVTSVSHNFHDVTIVTLS